MSNSATKSLMKTFGVQIYRRLNKYYFVPITESIKSKAAGRAALAECALDVSATVKGTLVKRSLGKSRGGSDQTSDFLSEALFRATKVKNWAEFVKGAFLVHAAWDGKWLILIPTDNAGSAKGFLFRPQKDEIRLFRSSTHAAIGAGLDRAFARCELPSDETRTEPEASPDERKAQRQYTMDERAKSDYMTRLLQKLIRLGFLKRCELVPPETVRARIKEKRYPFLFETGRVFLADAEELTESGVVPFVRDAGKFLSAEGCELKHVEDVFNPKGPCGFKADGLYFLLYSKLELATRDLWALTLRRLFGAINYLLEERGSSERLFSLYDGNDAMGVFLTPEMAKAIEASGLLSRDEIPRSMKPIAPKIQLP